MLKNALEVDFYKAKYRAAGVLDLVMSAVQSGGSTDLLAQLPILECEELIANSERMRSPQRSIFRVSCSGGSLGKPKIVYRTARDWHSSVENMERVLRTCGLKEGDVLLILQPFGIWSSGHLALDACERLNAMAVPVGLQHDSTQILDFIRRFEVTVVFATPSLWKWVTAQAERDAEASLRVLLAGEKLYDCDRRIFQEMWRGGVLELYGSEETDALGSECGHCPGMHILERSFIFELLGASGRIEHDRPGTYEGDLAITSLYHEGTPLIRYRLGDIVRIHRADRPCVCGRTEARLEVVGKSRQFVQLFDATKLYLYQLERVVENTLGRRTPIQIIVDSGPGALEIVEIVIEGHADPHELSSIEKALARCSLDLADSVSRQQVKLRVRLGRHVQQDTAKGKQMRIIDRRKPVCAEASKHECTI